MGPNEQPVERSNLLQNQYINGEIEDVEISGLRDIGASTSEDFVEYRGHIEVASEDETYCGWVVAENNRAEFYGEIPSNSEPVAEIEVDMGENIDQFKENLMYELGLGEENHLDPSDPLRN